MAQFPLVLAIEPRLLPYARLNGFSMDRKVCVVPILRSLVADCDAYSQYRNFVFRRMFEKPAIMFESRTAEIMKNVRELSRLDPEYESVFLRARLVCVFSRWLMCFAFLRSPRVSMFLSRTVAAEICMEAKTNEPAYTALKRLDKEGVLRFELSYVTAPLYIYTNASRSPNAAAALLYMIS